MFARVVASLIPALGVGLAAVRLAALAATRIRFAFLAGIAFAFLSLIGIAALIAARGRRVLVRTFVALGVAGRLRATIGGGSAIGPAIGPLLKLAARRLFPLLCVPAFFDVALPPSTVFFRSRRLPGLGALSF